MAKTARNFDSAQLEFEHISTGHFALMENLPDRRHTVNFDVGPFTVSVGYDPRDTRPCEIFILDRGKTGTDLSEILYELGVKVSRLMQGEDLP